MRRGGLVFQAPEFLLCECGSIVANASKRRRLVATDACFARSTADSIRTRAAFTEPRPGHASAASKLALDYGLSAYEGRLASSLELPLLTSDRALGRAATVTRARASSLEDLA